MQSLVRKHPLLSSLLRFHSGEGITAVDLQDFGDNSQCEVGFRRKEHAREWTAETFRLQ